MVRAVHEFDAYVDDRVAGQNAASERLLDALVHGALGALVAHGALSAVVVRGALGSLASATVGALAGGAYGFYKNWGNLFGGDEEKVEGARATGGPVAEGKDYLVGERGPELFTPNESGKITSNKDMKYGASMSDIKGKATNSYSDDEGTTHEEYEGGVKVKRKKDGSVEVSGPGGTSVFDKSGKEYGFHSVDLVMSKRKEIIIRFAEFTGLITLCGTSILTHIGSISSQRSTSTHWSSGYQRTKSVDVP